MKQYLCLFGLVTLLGACQSDPHRPVVENSRPAWAAQSPAVSVESGTPTTPAYPGRRRERLISVDSTGPLKLEAEVVSAAHIRLHPDWPDTVNADSDIYRIDTLLAGRFLAAYDYENQPMLYHRRKQQDTLWQVIYLPTKDYQSGREAVEVSLDTANLDGKGEAEVLVQLSSAGYGSGGGQSYKSFFLLDLNPPAPTILLRGQTAIIDEAFPGYFAMHNLELAPEDQYNGYERAITLRRREIVVSRIRKRGRNKDNMFLPLLTPLPAGRYRYQGGRMYRVVE